MGYSIFLHIANIWIVSIEYLKLIDRLQNTNVFPRVMTKANLQCGVGVEMAYYSTGSNIGRKDICCHCGIEEGKILIELKTQYKTVLPICDECKGKGLTPVVARPYGNKKK